MQFSNSTTEEGLIQEVDRLCDSDDTTYSLKAKTARLNMAMDRFFYLAFKSDGRWSFDDLNQTSPPIQSINLVSGTSRYELDDFTSEIINFLRLEILDSTGNGLLLRPKALHTVTRDYNENYEVTGTPREYLKYGKFVDLLPAPNYSVANGLTIYFERNKIPFISTDTTKEPGIPSLFHGFLPRHASLPYLATKNQAQYEKIKQEVMEDEAAIIDHFSHRDADVPTQLVPAVRRKG